MMYLSWAAFYEGGSDHSYFDILIPRLMEEIILIDGVRDVTIPSAPAIYLGRNGREVGSVSNEICENSKVFHIVFIHTDVGGRGLATNLESRSLAYGKAAFELCQWNSDRCVVLAPRHEMEAWALADPEAVMQALGYRGKANSLGIPSTAAEAERLTDPKSILEQAARQIQRRRFGKGGAQLFSSIAQNQSIEALRGSESFRSFESGLRKGLYSLGCIGGCL